MKAWIAIALALMALAVARAADRSVEVSWDANAAAEHVIEYRVYCATNPVELPAVFVLVAVVSTNAVIVQGLSAADFLGFYVTATNDAGESEPSQIAVLGLAPSPPTNVKVRVAR